MTQKNATPEQEEPVNEHERIRLRKVKVVEMLNEKFKSDKWMERLLKIAGQDESRIIKHMNSFVAYIVEDDGGGKRDMRERKYIADCSFTSISTSFLEAFQMGIEVGGGRDHAHMVNYDGQCELEITYKGFVYALEKHFDNAFVDARVVFEGDKFSCKVTDTTAAYVYEANPDNPFNESWDDIIGAFCYFSYTLENGEKVSRLERIGKSGIEMIKSKARGSFAWKDFGLEMVKKSILRRAAKIPFASIDFGDEEVSAETVDNRHFLLEGGSSVERMQLLISRQQELLREDEPTTQTKAGDTFEDKPVETPEPPMPDLTQEETPAQQAETAPPPEPTAPEDEGRFEEISDADFAETEDEEVPVVQKKKRVGGKQPPKAIAD